MGYEKNAASILVAVQSGDHDGDQVQKLQPYIKSQDHLIQSNL